MAKTTKAADFLAKMNLAPTASEAAPTAETNGPPLRASVARDRVKEPKSSRQGLKHIGAYLDRETVEKIALLRARLEMDNSQLVRHAIERLYLAESAKRKFGDA